MIRRCARPTILAMALLAALPATPFECVPEVSRLTLPGIWRDTKGAGDIVVTCQERTPKSSLPHESMLPERLCEGRWMAVRGAVGYKKGDLLFQVKDPSSRNQWDGCKVFSGWEMPSGSLLTDRPPEIRITFEDPARRPADKTPHFVYEVIGRPGETARFRFVEPLPR